MYDYQATVIQVIDGDTLKLDVDLGFSVHRHETVRLYGINCPEKNTEAGKAAIAYAANWLVSSGNRVMVYTIKDKREKYGRMLAVIYHDPGAKSLNDALIHAGHAVPYDGGKR